MDEWPAWSQDTREIADARVLAGLLAGLAEDGQTAASTMQVVEQLGITGVDPDHLAARLVQLGYFREDSMSLEPGSDTLLVTAQGRRAASEFAVGRRKIKVAPAARSAILRWLYETGADRRPNPSELLATPFSWFYGTQLTPDQVTDAARNLRDRGLLEALGTAQNDVLRLKLTPRGETCVERYDADPDALDDHTPAADRTDAVTSAASGSAPAGNGLTTVFLVHGHDTELKWEVKDFIEQIVDRTKVEVVILNQKANAGQTLIEKFEQHAGAASYAVVLLTPDDQGGPITAPQADLQPRARQNVVFELGYFFGRLGRKSVAAIHKGVEKPSDIQGWAYIDHTGQWMEELRREFRAAKLPMSS